MKRIQYISWVRKGDRSLFAKRYVVVWIYDCSCSERPWATYNWCNKNCFGSIQLVFSL